MYILLLLKRLFRIFSFVALVLAVLVGVLDSVRSVATHTVDLMSAHAILSLLVPQALNFMAGLVVYFIHPEAWRTIVQLLIDTPACVVLLVISLVFWMIGYKKTVMRPAVFKPVI